MIIIQICIKKLAPFEQHTFLREYRMSLSSCFPSTCLFYRLFNCFLEDRILLQCWKVRDLTVNATHVSTGGTTWMNKWIIINFFINRKIYLCINFILRWNFNFSRLSEVIDGVIITNSVEVCSIIFFSGASVSWVSSCH